KNLDPARHRFLRADITDKEAMATALEDTTDAIVHIAAESHVDRSIACSDAFLRTNVLGTQVLLDAARAKGVRRFLLVSTDEVMGSLPDNQAASDESAPLRPNNPYSASKAAAELLAR